eukprot:6461862-Amphidinium_carterae.1
MAWLPLHCSEESAPLDEAGDEIEQAECTRSWALHFSFQLADITYSDVLESTSASDTFYITGLSWKGFSKLETVDCLHVLSEAFEGVSLLPSTEKSTRLQTRQSSGSASASSDTTPAWMRMLDTFGTPHQNRIASASNSISESATLGGGDAANPDTTSDDHTAVAWQTMETLRIGAQDDTLAFEEHFRESLLGGAWQQQRTGRDTYGYQSVVKKHSVVSSCAQRFGLSASAAFETNVYQEHGTALSMLWRMRMYHLAQHWDEMGRPE